MSDTNEINPEIKAAMDKLKAAADTVKSGMGQPADQRLDDILALKMAYDEYRDLQVQLNAYFNPKARAYIDLYEIKGKPTKAERQKANNAAIKLVEELKARGVFDEADNLISAALVTDEERAILAKYTGAGGGLKSHKGKTSSQYEYYTPIEVADAVWDVFSGLGFSGGQVLDPCAGTGIFGATAPSNAGVTAIELDRVSGMINAAILGENQSVTVSNFEGIAKATPDDSLYDAVVANVPFGPNGSRGKNKLDDDKHQDKTLQGYFILRSLEKLKYGGMAAFITPHSVVSGTNAKNKELRALASEKAEFLGAIRLPNATFEGTSAEVVTDVIFFRKHTLEQTQKITAAKSQANSSDVLNGSGVLWGEFIKGDYFDSRSKNILGTFVKSGGKGEFDRDRVELPEGKGVDSVPELMREASGLIDKNGRIDWSKFDGIEIEEETAEIGDTRYINGAIQQFDGVMWVDVESEPVKSEELLDTLETIQTPLNGLDASGAKAVAAIAYTRIHNPTEIKDWWIEFDKLAEKVSPDNHDALWHLVCVALAVEEAMSKPLQNGESYATANPVLTENMEQAVVYNKALKLETKGGQIANAVKRLKKQCGLAKKVRANGEKSAFSDTWLMAAENDVPVQVEFSSKNLIDNLMYKNKSQWLSPDDVKAALGDDEDISPAGGWCWNKDGQICRVEDYFVGSLAAFYDRIDKEIAETEGAGNVELANILRTQKEMAISKCTPISLDNMTFGLRSPLVSPDDKVQFLQASVEVNSTYHIDKGEFETRPSGKTGDWNNDQRIASRIGAYINTGNASLGLIASGLKGLKQEEAISKLTNLIVAKNTEFNIWVRSNKKIMAALEKKANDPKNLRFDRVSSTEETSIAGMKESLTLHSYQASYVRAAGREFSGVNAFDVGLGKTFTALAVAQHVQNMGAKSRTIFVVPSAVLGNWYKEASSAYESLDDCFFVGLTTDKNGKRKASSSLYDDHLVEVANNFKYRKIFMTAEAFERIKFNEDTAIEFADYLGANHVNYNDSVVSAADSERAEGEKASVVKSLLNKKGAAPNIENMGIDSIIIDEAHIFKNSITLKKNEGAKLLALTKASARGMDAQAKAWYVRSRSPKNDGVILLTATPVTNSPLEIYSMLSLATGHETVNAACLGIKGGDEFIESFCEITQQEIETLTGEFRVGNVFTGLNNAEVLGKMMNEFATVENAKTVGAQIVVPDAHEVFNEIELTPDVKSQLNIMKAVYSAAKKSMKKQFMTPEESELLFEALQSNEGANEELLAHPFNLMTKMVKLTSDPDLANDRSVYTTESPEDADKLIAEWNKKPPTEKRINRLGASDDQSFITDTKVLKPDSISGEKGRTEFTIQIIAVSDEPNVVSINSVDGKLQDAFEAMADKLKIKLSVTIPPKLAALIDNINHQRSNPRGVDDEGKKIKEAKQIIFSDMIGQHNKIRLLLSTKCGTPKNKIAIITGQRNNNPETIQDIQDGFNANGDDNRYNIIIANEKAEVGINLQKGTQAIHHLTVGWTPDSLQQRNGRGVRQGNKTEQVTIYHYDAKGTFDSIRRNMVSAKANWIDSLLVGGENGHVEVSGGMTKEQADLILEVMGDENAIEAVRKTQLEQDERAKTEKLMRERSAAISMAGSMFNNASKDSEQLAREIFKSKLDDLNRAIKEVRAPYIRKKDNQPLDIVRLKSVIEEFIAFMESSFVESPRKTPKNLVKEINGGDISRIAGFEIQEMRYSYYLVAKTSLKAALSADELPYFNDRISSYGEPMTSLMIDKRSKAVDALDSAMDALVKSAKSEDEKAAFKSRADKVASHLQKAMMGERDDLFGAAIIGDKILAVGDILLHKGGEISLLASITGRDRSYQLIKTDLDGERERGAASIRYLPREVDYKKPIEESEIIYDGTPRHAELLRKLAEIDDAQQDNAMQKRYHQPIMFSDYWPPIMEYRKPQNEILVEASSSSHLFNDGLTPVRLIIDWWSHLDDPFCAEMARQNAVLRDKHKIEFVKSDGDSVSFRWNLGFGGVVSDSYRARRVISDLIGSRTFLEYGTAKALSIIPNAHSFILEEIGEAKRDFIDLASKDKNADEVIAKMNGMFNNPLIKEVLTDAKNIALAFILGLSEINSTEVIKAVIGLNNSMINAVADGLLNFKAVPASRVKGAEDKEGSLTLGDMIEMLQKDGKLEALPYVAPEIPPAKFALLFGETYDNQGIIRAAARVALKESSDQALKDHFSISTNRNAQHGCKYFGEVKVSDGDGVTTVEKAWLVLVGAVLDDDIQDLIKSGALKAVHVNYDANARKYVKGSEPK
ncbi:MAG: N-6 DNA methylase [Enterovibrio sp.]